MFAYHWPVVNPFIPEPYSRRFKEGYMLVNLRSLTQQSLYGPTLVDDLGLPRFWAAV
jgi:hypothetical protein